MPGKNISHACLLLDVGSLVILSEAQRSRRISFFRERQRGKAKVEIPRQARDDKKGAVLLTSGRKSVPRALPHHDSRNQPRKSVSSRRPISPALPSARKPGRDCKR